MWPMAPGCPLSFWVQADIGGGGGGANKMGKKNKQKKFNLNGRGRVVCDVVK
jgi:hypothetical protein